MRRAKTEAVAWRVRRENCDDKSLFPFLSGAAQETGEHGQQRDGRVGYPTSGGGGLLVLARLKLLHGISHQLKSTVIVCESLFDSITAVPNKRIIFITARRESDFESIVWRVSDSQIHYRVV